MLRVMLPSFTVTSSLCCMLLAALLFGPTTAFSAQGRATEVIFEMADADHNQLISEAEYHAAMQRRFEQLDTNKDGNLTRQEMDEARANARERLQGLRNGGGRLAN